MNDVQLMQRLAARAGSVDNAIALAEVSSTTWYRYRADNSLPAERRAKIEALVKMSPDAFERQCDELGVFV